LCTSSSFPPVLLVSRKFNALGLLVARSGEIDGYVTSSSDDGGRHGGGVYVGFSSTFTMNGGEISGNTVYFYYHYTLLGTVYVSTDYSYGGGVYTLGTFTMTDGEIRGNTTTRGGGVGVGWGTFTMTSGTISGNTADNLNSVNNGYGGGVLVQSSGTFTMTGGTVYGRDAEETLRNTVPGGGRGVAVYDDVNNTSENNTITSYP
jgi:hypothetical protein